MLVAPMGFDVRASNVWTQRNKTCDFLSRELADEQLPTVLAVQSDLNGACQSLDCRDKQTGSTVQLLNRASSCRFAQHII